MCVIWTYYMRTWYSCQLMLRSSRKVFCQTARTYVSVMMHLRHASLVYRDKRQLIASGLSICHVIQRVHKLANYCQGTSITRKYTVDNQRQATAGTEEYQSKSFVCSCKWSGTSGARRCVCTVAAQNLPGRLQ